MKRLRRILTVVAMTFMASVSCYADIYCEGSTERCPEGTICGEIGELEMNEEDLDPNLWENEGRTYTITGTGTLACFHVTAGGGDYVKIGDKYILYTEYEEVGHALGYDMVSEYYTKDQDTIPLTDAFFPLTLALGAYGYMIWRRKKNRQ